MLLFSRLGQLLARTVDVGRITRDAVPRGEATVPRYDPPRIKLVACHTVRLNSALLVSVRGPIRAMRLGVFDGLNHRRSVPGNSKKGVRQGSSRRGLDGNHRNAERAGGRMLECPQ